MNPVTWRRGQFARRDEKQKDDVLLTRTEAATARRANKMLDTRSAVIASVECKDATGQRLKNSGGGAEIPHLELE